MAHANDSMTPNLGGTQGALPAGGKLPPTTEDGSKMKVHNADLFVELMQSNDWNTSKAGEKCVKEMTAAEYAKKKKLEASMKSGGTGTFGVGGGTGTLNGTSAAERAKRSREAFMEKQTLRDHEFKMKLDVAKKESERKSKERAEKKEKAFERSFEKFQETNRTLAEEVEEAITADEQWRQRKKERLYNEWMLKVFQPMQDQINGQIASMTRQEIEERRRGMFQAFLDESNKKTNGLFRDIVIESDYDPLQHAQSNTITYGSVSLADDPTKNRATREFFDPRTKGLIMHVNSKKAGHHNPMQLSSDKRTAVPVDQWNNMEATPYGRYSNEDQDPEKRKFKPGFMKSSIKPDHYNVVEGEAGRKLLREESHVKGKKIVKPPFIVEAEKARSAPMASSNQPVKVNAGLMPQQQQQPPSSGVVPLPPV